MIHASAVSIDGLAVLICGVSGSGKSSLALQLMALGGGLIADDQTKLERHGDQIFAVRPATLPAQIEARGIGMLPAQLVAPAPIVLIADLDLLQTDRLPDPETREILGKTITVWRNTIAGHFPAAIFHYLSTMSNSNDQKSH